MERNLSKGEKIAYVVAYLTWLVVGFIVFMSIDKLPATLGDYSPLRRTVQKAKTDKSVLKQDGCKISFKGDQTVVEIENQKAKITAVYNKEFRLTEAYTLGICIACIYCSWTFSILASLFHYLHYNNNNA